MKHAGKVIKGTQTVSTAVTQANPGTHDHMVECLTQLFHIHPVAQTRAKRGNQSWIYRVHQRRRCSDS